MNAVPKTIAAPLPARTAAELSDALLRGALESSSAAGRPLLAVLEESSGLGGDTLMLALGAKLHYPVLDGAELGELAPAFELLAAGECAKRGCVIVKRGGEYLAVIGDPFDGALRGWLELKVPAEFSWHLAASGEISAFLARHEQGLKAMDVSALAAAGEAAVDGDVENCRSRPSAPTRVRWSNWCTRPFTML